MRKKKVLIITYYWPPGGGGGVQRWLKFAKYLPVFDWEPLIFTPENPEFSVIDHSLEKDIDKNLKVIKYPIWEPYQLFKKFSGRSKNEKVNTGLLFDDKKPGFKEKTALWIRGNLLIPDPRVFWARPAFRHLQKKWDEIEPDIVITTGPPHSMHLIGLRLQKFYNIPWITDFRDPWAGIDILDIFHPTGTAIRKQQKLEEKVLKNATKVLSVSKSWGEELKITAGDKVAVITNGFDKTDFTNMDSRIHPGKFRISHLGIINSLRNPKGLWQKLEDLCHRVPGFYEDLELNLTGTVDPGLVRDFKYFPLISKKLEVNNYLEHDQLIREYNDSACLLLLLNNSRNAKGHIPGKLFEYLATRTPILVIGPEDGDAAGIAKESGGGFVADPADEKAIEDAILKIYHLFKSEKTIVQRDIIDRFSREYLAGELAKLMNEIIN
jgi:glycosyltransferase involved in cell wall biosynthesis